MPQLAKPDESFGMPQVDIQASEKEIADFSKSVQDLVKKRDFVRLEKEANGLADSKARFIGGGWKIHSFYRLITAPPGNADSDWQSLIAFAKDWLKAIPDSATAASTLATAYIQFAWKARGETLAKDVSERSWKLFHERLDLASEILRTDPLLENPCYLYYEALLTLALGQNWDRTSSETAFREAIAFDMDYDYFYTSRAKMLLPKWGGEPGEWEAFARDVREAKGSPRGPQLYYRIVAAVMNESSVRFFGEYKPSWAHAKEGFRSLSQQYGLTKRMLNEFASMAYNARDSRVACMAFMQIGNADVYDPQMWQHRWKFETARTAATQMCSIPRLDNQAP